MRHLVCLTTAVIMLTACAGIQCESAGPGHPLPLFAVTTLGGDTVTSGDLSREDALLVFFHTLCPDCQRELPQIQRIHEERPGLRILCISRAEGAQDVSRYWRQTGLTLDVAACEDRKVYELFATSGIPRVYLLREGIIIAEWDDHNMLQADTFLAKY